MCNESNQFDNLRSILHSQTKKHLVFTSDDDSAIQLNKVCLLLSLDVSLLFVRKLKCVVGIGEVFVSLF